MPAIKAVIDTNILVSILKGSPALTPLYSAFKTGKFKLIVSGQLLKEMSRVLRRPELKIEPRDIKELFRLVKIKAWRIEPAIKLCEVCRDPKDEFILELALSARADLIVTGDKDLLVLSPFRGIPVITAKAFIELL